MGTSPGLGRLEPSPALPVATPKVPLTGLAATFRSLRHRNYRLYFFGQLISLHGAWMQSSALTWLAYRLTGQSKWPALVAASQVLPTFLFGTLGGTLADRLPKRSLLCVTQSIMMVIALLLASLVAGAEVVPWQLLVLTTAAGVVQAIDLPARLSFVVEMVGRDDLMNAVALNSLMFNIARAVGPALGGLLLVWLGPEVCFLANGLSYVAVVIALLRMDVGLAPAAAAPAQGTAVQPVSFWARLGAVAGNGRMAILILLAGTVAMCGWPVLTLLPAIAQRQLGLEARGFSVMLCSIGVGALIAALTVARFGSMDRSRWFIGCGLCVVPAGLVGLSVVANLLQAVLCCSLIGFGLILFLATGQSMVQLSAGDHNRGRLMGLWAMALSGAVPLGNLLAGLAADRWGVSLVLHLQGLLCGTAALMLLALYGLWRQSGEREAAGEMG